MINFLKILAELIKRAIESYDKTKNQDKADKINNDPASAFIDDFGMRTDDKNADTDTGAK